MASTPLPEMASAPLPDIASVPLPDIALVPLSCGPATETGAEKTATSDAPRTVKVLALFARIIFIAPLLSQAIAKSVVT
jgi:hypothetical protein